MSGRPHCAGAGRIQAEIHSVRDPALRNAEQGRHFRFDCTNRSVRDSGGRSRFPVAMSQRSRRYASQRGLSHGSRTLSVRGWRPDRMHSLGWRTVEWNADGCIDDRFRWLAPKNQRRVHRTHTAGPRAWRSLNYLRQVHFDHVRRTVGSLGRIRSVQPVRLRFCFEFS